MVKDCVERKNVYKKSQIRDSLTISGITKLFWQQIKLAREKSGIVFTILCINTLVNKIREGDGYLINEEGKVLKLWKEYFERLFESDDCLMRPPNVDALASTSGEEREDMISVDQIMKAMISMKVSKGAGFDSDS